MRGRGRTGALVASGVLALGIVARPAAAAERKDHGPVGNPAAWFGADAYPPAALRANEQGRVVAEVQIDDTGKLVSCKVIGSSGSTTLDQATCAIALDNRHYQPATDRKGRPIAAKVTLPVRWVLPNGGFGEPVDVTAAPPPARSLALTVTIDGDGLLEGCHADLAGDPAGSKADPCEHMKIGSKVSAGFRRDGRPVGARIVTRSSQQVMLDP